MEVESQLFPGGIFNLVSNETDLKRERKKWMLTSDKSRFLAPVTKE